MAINPFFLFFAGFLLALLGKKAFGRWFNPVSFYSIIWGGLLGMHELKLLRYTNLHMETWLLIFSSWGVFVLGGYTALLGWKAKGVADTTGELKLDERSLAKAILVLCAIGSVGVVQHWLVLIRNFGSISTAIVLGSIVYSARIQGELPGMVPYIADAVLAAVSLAGVYFASRRRMNLIVIIPLILASLEAMAWMGRAKILIAGVLIFSSFSFSVMGYNSIKYSKRAKWGIVVSLALILALIALSSEGIRSIRKTNEKFYAASQTLNKLRGVPFLTPSIYVYMSGHVAVLDKFLQYEMEGNGEKIVFGENTLAPIYRMVSRLIGEGDYVPAYQRFYRVPIDLNTGTYLRELYVDFGEAGALIFPYILGFVTSLLYLNNRRSPRLWKIVLLSHLFVIIGFSFAMQAMRWGYWWDSVIISLIVANILEKRLVSPASSKSSNAVTNEV